MQTLVSHHRKVRDYEDAVLPAWVVDWERSHPEDARQAQATLATEPAPKHKIPKGREGRS